MKIKINTPKEATEKPYPKFMKTDNGVIVYFIRESCGLIFVGYDGETTGDLYSDNFDMIDFYDLPDGFSITLTNGE